MASARAHGIKAAAREFGCSRNTVRKWLRRDQPSKPSALVERSRRPKCSPNQIPKDLEGQIIKRRRQTGFGAERLQREFRLSCSPNRGKEWQSPLQILQRQAPALVGVLLNWQPLNLAKRYHFDLPNPLHRGHDVPRFPFSPPLRGRRVK